MTLEGVTALAPVVCDNGDPMNPVLSAPGVAIATAAIEYIAAQARGIPLGGLQLWVDAAAATKSVDAGVCSVLPDRSSNGFDFTGAAGVDVGGLNGLDVLTFDGSQSMALADGASLSFLRQAPATVSIVCRIDDEGGAGVVPTFFGNGTYGGPGGRSISMFHEAGNFVVFSDDREVIEIAAAMALDTWTSFVALLDASAAPEERAFLIKDGTPTGDVDVGDGALVGGNFVPGSLMLGSSRSGFTPQLHGAIAELLVWDRQLSIAELGSVQDYLATKWGL